MSKLNKTLKSITADTIYFCFTQQAQRAHKKGERSFPDDRKVRDYAEQCLKSLKREVRHCKTRRDEALLGQQLLKRLKKSGKDYLNAFEF